MCNAYNLRHRNEVILDIARAMQPPLDELPEFLLQYRLGIKDRGLSVRLGGHRPISQAGSNQRSASPS